MLQADKRNDANASELYALDIDTGEMLWSYDTGFDYPFHPIIEGDVVFGVYQDAAAIAFEPNGRPFAVRLADGKEIWSNEDIWVDTSPVSANGRLFFFGSGIGKDGLLCLDANTGNFLWDSDEGLGTFSVPMVVVATNGVFGPSYYRRE